jgi:hypothetical protein
MIKYLRYTTSGPTGIGLGTTIEYPRRITGAAAGNGLGTTLNYLRGAAGNGRAQRPNIIDAQRAPSRASAWATRYMNTALRCTTSGPTGIGLGAKINYLRCTTSAATGNGLGTMIKHLQLTTSGAAGSGRAQ